MLDWVLRLLESACVDKLVDSLKLHPDQVDLLPGNLYSIAEAQFYPDARSLAVYSLLGELVGYVQFGRELASGSPKVFRLMIDRAHQGKGYGRAAMHAVISEVVRRGDPRQLLIAYQDRNQVARRLYASLGFVEQETHEMGKVTAALALRR